ncbi:MAG TPA: hypothetical protein VFY64_03145 [Nitrososphaeraceae archaeon]|nr:hypothetical protein [Nitrososphaeraceae archaeon]
MSSLGINCDPNAPFHRVAAVGFALASLYEDFNLRTIEIRTHDSHSFPICPIQLAVLLIEMELFWSERAALGKDHPAILSVEIGALNGTIVQIGNPHVSPVNVAGLNVDYYAIGVSTLGYDDLLVGAISIQ